MVKRIIDGQTYDTETATLVHNRTWAGDLVYEGLYQTRHGAFFLWWYDDDVGDIKPMSDEEAQKWLETHGDAVAALEQFFGDFPEAGAAERRITLPPPGQPV